MGADSALSADGVLPTKARDGERLGLGRPEDQRKGTQGLREWPGPAFLPSASKMDDTGMIGGRCLGRSATGHVLDIGWWPPGGLKSGNRPGSAFKAGT